MKFPSDHDAPLRVLFIGLKYDYGNPARGLSYEYVNFFETLARMDGVKATLFPFDEILRERGRDAMNRLLLEKVNEVQPDICFFFLFTDEIKKETIRVISERKSTVTLNWFADDHWRFHEFTKYWAPLFHWSVTTDREAVDKYHAIGCRNVIRSQWGFNHFLYKPVDISPEMDVSFVGQAHSNRKKFIEVLKRSGISVECWGRGWHNGRLSQEEMIALYSKSKINLNFSESSISWQAKPLAKVFLSRRADNSLHIKNASEMAAHFSTLLQNRRVQIKGRNFEIPGSGGFLLTQYAGGIEEYFVPGLEIATFSNDGELLERIQYFLSHDREREAIKSAGYQRALTDHTFQKRFEDIFQIIFQ